MSSQEFQLSVTTVTPTTYFRTFAEPIWKFKARQLVDRQTAGPLSQVTEHGVTNRVVALQDPKPSRRTDAPDAPGAHRMSPQRC